MGKQLPAIPTQVQIEPTRRALPARARTTGGWRRRSPITDALIDLMPDLLRVTRDAIRPTRSNAELLPSSGANGMTTQEIEIDVASPLVRRIVVRSTNSWSLSPDVALAGRQRRGGRLGLGAVSVAGLLLLGAAAARRTSLPFPGRSRERV
jgi:Ser/Thr protein kinase RdoA (MazF antagonist)